MAQPSIANDTALELPEHGPAMLALPNDKQRAFVAALFSEEAPRKGDGLLIYAAREAQYGTATSSTKSLSVIANRIVHDDRVQAAIAEHSRLVLRTIPPEAILALKDLIRDPKHRDHARAIAMVLDRTDPLQTIATVKIQDERPEAIAQVTEKVLARIEEIARRYNLGAPPATIIDGEFSVIEGTVPA
jgi:hypothetical protein